MEIFFALCTLLFLQYLRKLVDEGFSSILNLISLMALVDVFIPFAMYAAFEWYPPHLRSVQKLPLAMIYYSTSLALLGLGYWMVFKLLSGRDNQPLAVVPLEINRGLLILAMAVLASLYMGNILKGYAAARGFFDWLYLSCSRAGYGIRSDYQSLWDQLTTQLALPALGAYIALLGLLVQVEKKRRYMVYGFAALAVMMCLAAFSRATIAIFFFTFLHLLIAPRIGKEVTFRKRVWAGSGLIFLCVASFLFYGAARNYCDYRLQAVSNADAIRAQLRNPATSAIKNEILRLTRGEGLVGLAHILDFYEVHEKLGGKTYKDSLLMPVPRIIYKEKPMWYGAADITRPMDGVKSQDAVTIVGEAYANFGDAGIFMAIVWGGGLYLLNWLIRSRGYESIYPALLVPAVLTAMWMGSIGLMNQLVGFCIAWTIIRGLKAQSAWAER